MAGDISPDDILIIRPTNKNTKIQLEKTLSYLSLDRQSRIYFANLRIIKLVQICQIIIKLLTTRHKALNFGHYDTKISKFILIFKKFKKLQFYDDGIATFKILQRIKYHKNITHKTIFFDHVPPTANLSRNDLSLPITNSTEKKHYGLLIIGSPYAEKKFTTTSHYLNLIQDIQKKNSLSSVLYVAHRSESENKLKQISNMGIQVSLPELPIELIWANKSISADKIIGIGTSAILTLKVVFGDEPQYVSLRNIVHSDNVKSILKTEEIYHQFGIKQFL